MVAGADRREVVERAEVCFISEDMTLPPRHKERTRIFQRIQIELNHLEAWLEKYKAQVGRPVPSAPTSKDMAPKNKGGAPRKFDREAFMQQAAGLLAQPECIRPKTRQQLTAAMAEWWLETWGEEAKPSTLRAFVAEIYSPKD
jgi:hypothetical protein